MAQGHPACFFPSGALRRQAARRSPCASTEWEIMGAEIRNVEDKGRRPGNHQTPVSVASFVGQVGEEDRVDIAIPRLSLPFSSGDGSVRSGRLNELS